MNLFGLVSFAPLPRPGKVGAALAMVISAGFGWPASAELLPVPNQSFETPEVPTEVPYANPEVGSWEKTAQPLWYDPAQNQDTPWAFLAGQFFNVPFPDKWIDNCHGKQAAFLFALPEMGLFQDYDSITSSGETNHAFDAVYKPGKVYALTVGLIGGSGNMREGATLDLSLYYRDAAGNKVMIATTTVTNSPSLFTTNTHLVDFQVHLPAVKDTDPWAGKHIGIQLLSTVRFDLANGYWDVDNIRLDEQASTAPTLGVAGISDGKFSFTIVGEPGARIEILWSTNLLAPATEWTSLGIFDNPTGQTSASDLLDPSGRRYYRARRL